MPQLHRSGHSGQTFGQATWGRGPDECGDCPWRRRPGVGRIAVDHPVSVQLTQQTRCTMRNLRLRRGLYVVWGARPSMEESHLVGAFFKVFRGNVELVRHYDGRRAPPHLLPTAPGRSVPRMDLADCALGAHGPFGARGVWSSSRIGPRRLRRICADRATAGDSAPSGSWRSGRATSDDADHALVALLIVGPGTARNLNAIGWAGSDPI
jgi:hypothetical protein